MALTRTSLSSKVLGRARRHQLFRCHRQFSIQSCRRTDGVFHELTAQRVAIPWIEALNKKRLQEKSEDTAGPSKSAVPEKRDLSPKRMSDSYHSVILPLARDPWLSDTYLNVNGNIRCAQNSTFNFCFPTDEWHGVDSELCSWTLMPCLGSSHTSIQATM